MLDDDWIIPEKIIIGLIKRVWKNSPQKITSTSPTTVFEIWIYYVPKNLIKKNRGRINKHLLYLVGVLQSGGSKWYRVWLIVEINLEWSAKNRVTKYIFFIYSFTGYSCFLKCLIFFYQVIVWIVVLGWIFHSVFFGHCNL